MIARFEFDLDKPSDKALYEIFIKARHYASVVANFEEYLKLECEWSLHNEDADKMLHKVKDKFYECYNESMED